MRRAFAARRSIGFCRPPRAAEVRREKVRHGVSLPGALGTAAAAAVLALLGGAFWLLAGDPHHALSRLRGESITVEPAATSVGEEIAGASRSFSVTLTNHTNQPVRIIGGTAGCGCIATGDLPLRLPPGESGSIRVRIKFAGAPGRFQHRFTLYTDDKTQPVVTARFRGRVLPPKS